jgi:solute carrier family 10 (sodium/bile acid cotransporter), member 7
MIRGLGRNFFLVGLFVVVALAFVLPGPGAKGGLLHSEVTTRAAVVAIFLVQGLVLALEALRDGLLRWRLHLLVQAFTYLIFPLLGLGFDALVGRWLAPELRLGFLFLAVLPTTISTAIVFTSLAGGNAAAALVNATISNVLGVVVTPLWVGLLLQVRGEPVPVWPLVRELALLVLLPLAIGQALRPLLRRWIDAHKARAGQFNSVLVLFIVYAAFSDSVAKGVWVEHGWVPALQTLAGAVALFVVVMVLTVAAERAMRLEPADRIAALFCAPQKTLAAGVPMANLIFSAHPALGLILLPVMIYHPVQLLVGGLLVNWLRARSDAVPGER